MQQREGAGGAPSHVEHNAANQTTPPTPKTKPQNNDLRVKKKIPTQNPQNPLSPIPRGGRCGGWGAAVPALDLAGEEPGGWGVRSHQLIQESADAGAGLCRTRHGLVAHGANAAHLQPLHQAPAGQKVGRSHVPAREKPLSRIPPLAAPADTHFLWKACWHGSTPSSSFTLKSSRQTAQVCCRRRDGG